VDPTGPAFDLLRVLALSLLLVFGGVGAASPAGHVVVEEAVAGQASGATTGFRRRQLAHRPDALRRRHHPRGTSRIRPGAAPVLRGRGTPASVRGPPVR
jgi:hypothetical protein